MVLSVESIFFSSVIKVTGAKKFEISWNVTFFSLEANRVKGEPKKEVLFSALVKDKSEISKLSDRSALIFK